MACDDAVLAAGVPADAYADGAVGCSARVLQFNGSRLRDGIRNASALRERFAHLFEWRQEATASSRRTAIAIPLLLVLMTSISFAEKIYKIGPGIAAPVVLEKQEPVYPSKEKAEKVEGKVVLNLVVGTDRRAHDIKVTRSVTPALDASAITASPELGVSAWDEERKARCSSSHDRNQFQVVITPALLSASATSFKNAAACAPSTTR